MRIIYLLMAASLTTLWSGWIPLPDDRAVYITAAVFASAAIWLSRKSLRKAAGHALLFFNVAYWGCYFWLPEGAWRWTASLQSFKTLAFVLLVAIELGALWLLVKTYRASRRQAGLPPEESFLTALKKFPMPDGLLKLFSIEFNIWHALLSSLLGRKPRMASGYIPVAKTLSGYREGLIVWALLLTAGVTGASLYFLPGYWPALPALALIYLVLLFNCEAYNFKNSEIYVGSSDLVMQNGIFGTLRVPLEDISTITSDVAESAKNSALRAYRLAGPNISITLRKPLECFGRQYRAIHLHTDSPDGLINAVRL
jgi:hypothetical protein